MVNSSIFESEIFGAEEKIIPYKEFLPLLKDYLKSFCDQHGIDFNGENEITFKSTKIIFGVYCTHGLRRYFITFYPENIWEQSYKSVLLPAFGETIEFFNTLPSVFSVGEVEFKKSQISGEVNISEWEFSTDPDLGKNKIKEIANLYEVKKLGTSMFDNKRSTITRKLLIINSAGILNKLKLGKIKDKISPLFSTPPEEFVEGDTSLETIDRRSDKNNIFVIFFGTPDKIEKYYTSYKKYLITNDIPSQFISTNNLEKNTLNWGFENLIFEILKKAQQKDSIYLHTRPSSSNIDGYLCLSDIWEFENNKFFGASISFSGNGQTEDLLEIYNDIDYKSKFDSIRFEEGDISRLGSKINSLSALSGKTIDIFVSKRWKKEDVSYICKLLERGNVSVRKFFYIGSKANRFLFSSLSDETTGLFKHPYIIWDNRAASIQTNSKIQLYGTMFPIFLELVNPWSDNKLEVDDLENVLWLTKKRIYRIDNFFNLKSPEILSMMKEAGNLKIKNLSGKLRISFHNLI